ncbi:MAG TPA: glycosyltransferase [Acetobacteraceae bacterium]|nr:glycosyltransferase [Acetobacteraceae bacterium]
MTPRPRLLFLSPRFLFPLNEGGKIRTANILRHLKGGAFEIVLASPEGDPPRQFAAELAGACDRHVAWEAAPVLGWRRVPLLAGRLPVGVATDASRAARAVMAREIAAAPDLIVVDFPHAAIHVPQELPPSVLFTHNVEAEIFDRHAEIARGLWRIVWRDQARKMRSFEAAVLRRFDTVIAVSARDARKLEAAYRPRRVEVIDTGVDLAYFAPHPPPPPPAADGGTIVFSGAMDSPANIDGIGFLLDAVWPHLRRARSRLRVLVVGRNPPRALVERARAAGGDWEFTGYVDDIRPWIAQGHVAVIPLRAGSGTRIKAFEAMAAGRPVVSTGLGIEGLQVEPEAHFLLADTAEDFAAQVLRLLDDAPLRAGLAARARALLEARFSWAHVARQFETICLSTLARARPPSQSGRA